MEINVTVLDIGIRKILGWDGSQKTVDFTGQTVTEFLKFLKTTEGMTLYDKLTENNNEIGKNFLVWLNCTSLIQEDGMDKPLQEGDKVVLMSMLNFPYGG